MASGYFGADVAQLRELGERITASAGELESAQRLLGQCLVTTTQWKGPDAAGFRGDWAGSHQPQMARVASALHAAAQALRANADQQERASAADGGGPSHSVDDLFERIREALPWGSGLRPPTGEGEEALAAWWNGLSDEEREAVIEEHPERIGNCDGIPAWARDRANRALIDDYRSELEAERDRLKADLADNWFGGLFTNDDRRLELVEGKLSGIDAIEGTLAQGNRQLLLLDTSGEQQLKAAVAIGNVDTADHVAVFTPGFKSTVQGSLGDCDGKMAALHQAATAASRKYGDNGTVATVSWLGYEAPQANEVLDTSGRSVANESLARIGSSDLAAFYRGVNASREEDPHLTALGHSYGSTTTGLALQSETGVDDAVFFGSPGIGTDDVANLRVSPGRAYQIEARDDVVADFGRFGKDPSWIPGIHSLSADQAGISNEVECRALDESSGHSEYLKTGTTSLHNIASVVAGAPRMVVRG